jgi:peptidoglycan-associated lipoprotein
MVARSIVIVVALVVTGCAKKVVTSPPVAAQRPAPGAAAPSAPEPAPSAGTRALRADREGELGPIYFDYDTAILSDGARATLKSLGDTLWKHPKLNVSISGHADERGTPEYNIALGDSRASAARNYLVGLGIDRARIRTISYGEERPAVSGADEVSWSKNRRAEFELAVTSSTAR